MKTKRKVRGVIRTEYIGLVLTPDERRQVEQLAAREALGIGPFMRMLTMREVRNQAQTTAAANG